MLCLKCLCLDCKHAGFVVPAESLPGPWTPHADHTVLLGPCCYDIAMLSSTEQVPSMCEIAIVHHLTVIYTKNGIFFHTACICCRKPARGELASGGQPVMSVQSCRLAVVRDVICPMQCNPASVKLEHPCTPHQLSIGPYDSSAVAFGLATGMC